MKLEVETIRPALIFDTSALNALADDSDSASLTAGLKAGCVVCLTALNISEIFANTSADRRRKLLDLCKLFVAEGSCLAPHHWIIERLVTAYQQGRSFDWRAVNAGFRDGAIEIARQEIIDDQLAKEEREHLRKHEEELFDHLDKRRDRFQQVFAKGTKQPK